MRTWHDKNIESLYPVFNNVDGYIEENNGNKYLIFAFSDKNKKALKKYKKLWDGIKNQVDTLNSGEPIEYEKDFMKIEFESDDNLPLGKILSISSITIVTRSVFQEDNKYYSQVYLHECAYESVGELWRECTFCTGNILVINIDRAFVLNGTKKG